MMTTSRREDLILAHLPQVELLARRLHRRCPRLELDDLISAGTIGLIQAVDRFDPSRNLKLKTLADHRIRGAMLGYLRQIDPAAAECTAVSETARCRDGGVRQYRRDSDL